MTRTNRQVTPSPFFGERIELNRMKVGRRPSFPTSTSVFGKYGIREVGMLLLVFGAAWLCCRVGRCSSRAPGRVVEGNTEKKCEIDCDTKLSDERKDCITEKLGECKDLNVNDCKYISESTNLCSDNNYRKQCPLECYMMRFVDMYGKKLTDIDEEKAKNACAIVTTTYDHQSDTIDIPKWLVQINPDSQASILLLDHWKKKKRDPLNTNLCVTTMRMSLDRNRVGQQAKVDCKGSAKDNIYHQTKNVNIPKLYLPPPLRNVLDNVEIQNKQLPVINIKEIDVNKIIEFLDYNWPGSIHSEPTPGKIGDKIGDKESKSYNNRGDELLFKSEDGLAYLLMRRHICNGDKINATDKYLDEPPKSDCVLKEWKTFCEMNKYPDASTLTDDGGRICRHPKWIQAAADQSSQYAPEDGKYEDAKYEVAKAVIVDYVNNARNQKDTTYVPIGCRQ